MQPQAEYVEKTQPTREEHWKYRQRWPHSHCCVTEPYLGEYLFVSDLGLDTLFVYEVRGTAVIAGPALVYRGSSAPLPQSS
eukprot:788735-Prorocentrum_minimum.AAC.1